MQSYRNVVVRISPFIFIKAETPDEILADKYSQVFFFSITKIRPNLINLSVRVTNTLAEELLSFESTYLPMSKFFAVIYFLRSFFYTLTFWLILCYFSAYFPWL